MDIIRDIEKVRRVVAITERFVASVRDFPCGHKPNGVGGKCDACEALKEWDALSSNGKPSDGATTPEARDEKAERKAEARRGKETMNTPQPANAVGVGISELLAEATSIICDMTDDELCSYDHYGYCHTHSLHERPCPHERAKGFMLKILSANDGDEGRRPAKGNHDNTQSARRPPVR